MKFQLTVQGYLYWLCCYCKPEWQLQLIRCEIPVLRDGADKCQQFMPLRRPVAHVNQGPVVQGIVSLIMLVVKMLTVLVNTISNLQVFLLKKMYVAFANAKDLQKLLTFFSKKY